MVRTRRAVLLPVLTVASVLVVVLTLSACGGGGTDADRSASELAGTWVLDQAASGSPDFGVTVTVDATFAEGAVSGSSGCNRYNAGFETGAGGSLTVGPVRSTKMMCTPEAAAIEDDYVARLAAARSFAVRDATLRVANSAGADLVFHR